MEIPLPHAILCHLGIFIFLHIILSGIQRDILYGPEEALGGILKWDCPSVRRCTCNLKTSKANEISQEEKAYSETVSGTRFRFPHLRSGPQSC